VTRKEEKILKHFYSETSIQFDPLLGQSALAIAGLIELLL
jgi:hypothetical protein